MSIYAQKVKFFYSGGESEKSLYPDRLVMVKTERKVSARKYYEEFLYSETGALMFYFQKAEGDDDVPAERRVYFLGGRIRVDETIVDGKSRDRLNAGDHDALAKQVMAASNKLSEIFKRSIDL